MMAHRPMLLDRFLPTFHFNEIHSISIRAAPERVFLSIKEVTAGEIPLLRLFFGVRALPAFLMGKRPRPFGRGKPFIEQALKANFVLLGEEEGRELVLGTVGQFWRVSGGSLRVSDAEEFMTLDRPENAKAAINFLVIRRGGVTRLRTETRIYVPGRGARRRFALYWRVISGGSGLLRLMWLWAIKRRAERRL